MGDDIDEGLVDKVSNDRAVAILPDESDEGKEVVLRVSENTAKTASYSALSVFLFLLLVAGIAAGVYYFLEKRRKMKAQKASEGNLQKTEEGKTTPHRGSAAGSRHSHVTGSHGHAEGHGHDENHHHSDLGTDATLVSSELTVSEPPLTEEEMVSDVNQNRNKNKNKNASGRKRGNRCCFCFICPPSEPEPTLEEIWKQKKAQQRQIAAANKARKAKASKSRALTAKQSLKLMEEGMRHVNQFQKFLDKAKISAASSDERQNRSRRTHSAHGSPHPDSRQPARHRSESGVFSSTTRAVRHQPRPTSPLRQWRRTSSYHNNNAAADQSSNINQSFNGTVTEERSCWSLAEKERLKKKQGHGQGQVRRSRSQDLDPRCKTRKHSGRSPSRVRSENLARRFSKEHCDHNHSHSCTALRRRGQGQDQGQGQGRSKSRHRSSHGQSLSRHRSCSQKHRSSQSSSLSHTSASKDDASSNQIHRSSHISSKDLRSSNKHHRSASRNHRSTSHNHRSESKDHRSSNQNHRSLNQNHRSVSRNPRSTSQNHRSASRNHRSASRNHRSASRNHRSTSQNHRSKSKSLRSTCKNPRSTSQKQRSASRRRTVILEKRRPKTYESQTLTQTTAQTPTQTLTQTPTYTEQSYIQSISPQPVTLTRRTQTSQNARHVDKSRNISSNAAICNPRYERYAHPSHHARQYSHSTHHNHYQHMPSSRHGYQPPYYYEYNRNQSANQWPQHSTPLYPTVTTAPLYPTVSRTTPIYPQQQLNFDHTRSALYNSQCPADSNVRPQHNVCFLDPTPYPVEPKQQQHYPSSSQQQYPNSTQQQQYDTRQQQYTSQQQQYDARQQQYSSQQQQHGFGAGQQYGSNSKQQPQYTSCSGQQQPMQSRPQQQQQQQYPNDPRLQQNPVSYSRQEQQPQQQQTQQQQQQQYSSCSAAQQQYSSEAKQQVCSADPRRGMSCSSGHRHTQRTVPVSSSNPYSQGQTPNANSLTPSGQYQEALPQQYSFHDGRHLNISQNYNCEESDNDATGACDKNDNHSDSESPWEETDEEQQLLSGRDDDNYGDCEDMGDEDNISETTFTGSSACRPSLKRRRQKRLSRPRLRGALLRLLRHPNRGNNNHSDSERHFADESLTESSLTEYENHGFRTRMKGSKQEVVYSSSSSSLHDDSPGSETVSLARRLFGLTIKTRKRPLKTLASKLLSRKKARRGGGENRPLLGGGDDVAGSSADTEDTTHEASRGTEPVDSGYDLSASLPSESRPGDCNTPNMDLTPSLISVDGVALSSSNLDNAPSSDAIYTHHRFSSCFQDHAHSSKTPRNRRGEQELSLFSTSDTTSPFHHPQPSNTFSTSSPFFGSGENVTDSSNPQWISNVFFLPDPNNAFSEPSLFTESKENLMSFGNTDTTDSVSFGNIGKTTARTDLVGFGNTGTSFFEWSDSPVGGQTQESKNDTVLVKLNPADLKTLSTDSDKEFRLLATQRWCEQQARSAQTLSLHQQHSQNNLLSTQQQFTSNEMSGSSHAWIEAGAMSWQQTFNTSQFQPSHSATMQFLDSASSHHLTCNQNFCCAGSVGRMPSEMFSARTLTDVMSSQRFSADATGVVGNNTRFSAHTSSNVTDMLRNNTRFSAHTTSNVTDVMGNNTNTNTNYPDFTTFPPTAVHDAEMMCSFQPPFGSSQQRPTIPLRQQFQIGGWTRSVSSVPVFQSNRPNSFVASGNTAQCIRDRVETAPDQDQGTDEGRQVQGARDQGYNSCQYYSFGSQGKKNGTKDQTSENQHTNLSENRYPNLSENQHPSLSENQDLNVTPKDQNLSDNQDLKVAQTDQNLSENQYLNLAQTDQNLSEDQDLNVAEEGPSSSQDCVGASTSGSECKEDAPTDPSSSHDCVSANQRLCPGIEYKADASSASQETQQASSKHRSQHSLRPHCPQNTRSKVSRTISMTESEFSRKGCQRESEFAREGYIQRESEFSREICHREPELSRKGCRREFSREGCHSDSEFSREGSQRESDFSREGNQERPEFSKHVYQRDAEFSRESCRPRDSEFSREVDQRDSEFSKENCQRESEFSREGRSHTQQVQRDIISDLESDESFDQFAAERALVSDSFIRFAEERARGSDSFISFAEERARAARFSRDVQPQNTKSPCTSHECAYVQNSPFSILSDDDDDDDDNEAREEMRTPLSSETMEMETAHNQFDNGDYGVFEEKGGGDRKTIPSLREVEWSSRSCERTESRSLSRDNKTLSRSREDISAVARAKGDNSGNVSLLSASVMPPSGFHEMNSKT